MRKTAFAVLLLFGLAIPGSFLSAYEISFPEEPVSYRNLTVTLEPASKDPEIQKARFYFFPKIGERLVYGDILLKEGIWSLTIPAAVLPVEELTWFAEILTAQGRIVRIPETGRASLELMSDLTPPEVEAIFPDDGVLTYGQSHIILVRADDDSEVELISALFDGMEVEGAEAQDGVIRMIVTPLSITDRSRLELTVADVFGNESRFTTEYALVRPVEEEEKAPFFRATGDLLFDLGLNYSGSGSVESTTPDWTLFTEADHTVMLDYDAGASGLVKLGPLELSGRVRLQDSRDIMELIDAVPSAIVSDFRDIMRLWHPWNFAQELGFTSADIREYDSGNSFFVGLTFFDDLLTYGFGDQSITFQNKTVSGLGFRGTSASISLPILEVAVGKGLSQLGEAGADWPQNFLGVQVGLNFFDYFWLQTNVSFITDFQGRYATLSDPDHVSIGTLYQLDGVLPEQNLVVGVGTGIRTPWFELSGDLGVTLYTSDSSTPVDIETLLEDLSSGADPLIPAGSADGVVDIINSILGIVPLFDYFPPTLGLASAAVDQSLWGILYGGTLDISPLGLKARFYKTDSGYKSLGASVTTDLLDIGADGSWKLGNFGLGIGYAYTRNNIPDILFNEILPLFITSDSDPTYTESDISEISHGARLELSTPSWGIFGSFGTRYDFTWAMTNAAELGFPNSSSSSENMAHKGTLLWKSGKAVLGPVSVTVGASTVNTFTQNIVLEGSANSDNWWDFSYKIDPRLTIGKVSVRPGFSHAWGTSGTAKTAFSYSANVSFPLGFIDRFTIESKVSDTIAAGGSREELEIGAGIGLKKAFGPLAVTLDLNGAWTDHVDDSKDEVSLNWKIGGKLGL